MTAALRIGAGAGFSADRFEPAVDLLRRVKLDVIVFECLAERTIALGHLERLIRPDRGFDPFLEERLEQVLPVALERGVRIVTNMGAANPVGAARATLAIARKLGLRMPRIAVIHGDDVTDHVRTVQPSLDTGETVQRLGANLVSANAYIGARSIADALKTGADIVIAGRVADPSLFLGPMLHHFGWDDHDWDRLAAGTAIGHLLECAGQVTGGYFADPGACDVPDLWNLGFPYAVVAEDGSARLAKTPDTGGRLDLMTVRAQLFYEVHDPRAYITPDVVADFTGIELEMAGPDEVLIRGARGRARPDQLKATVSAREGFIGEGQIAYAGMGATARAELAAEIIRRRIALRGLEFSEIRIDILGANALHGPQSTPSLSQLPEAVLRVAGRATDERTALLLGQEVQSLLTNGPAGGGGDFRRVKPVIGVHSALVPRSAAAHHIEMVE